MSESTRGLKVFFCIVAALFLLRVGLAYLVVPASLAPFLSVVGTTILVGLPIYAIFRAASHGWSIATAAILLVTGGLLHIFGALLVTRVLPEVGLTTVLVREVWQSGILLWTVGLGVLLSMAIRDKNLMIPVAIFLVGFDTFLVYNPEAPTAKMLRENPSIVQAVLYKIPDVKEQGAATGSVQDLAYVGPADFLFSATFFTLLFRHRMKTRQTLNWLIPVLILNILLVGTVGSLIKLGPISLATMPAMVPIGLTVLLVNRREFKLNKQELLGVLLVATLAVSLASYGIYRAASTPQEAPPVFIPEN